MGFVSLKFKSRTKIKAWCSRDLFRKRALSGRAAPGNLWVLLDLDLGDSYSRLWKLKGHNAVFNISAFYVFHVF